MGSTGFYNALRTHAPYAIWVCTVTAIALFLLHRFFDSGLPGDLLTIAALFYFLLTAYRVQAVMGLMNAFCLMFTATVITFVAEAIGVRTGWVFGTYRYTGELGFRLWGVPIAVVFVWNMLIAASYLIISGIWPHRTIESNRMARLRYSGQIALLTGLATMSADLIIDPIAVDFGLWVWDGGGGYFPDIRGGVPATNFLGWFCVTTLAVFIYQYCFAAALPNTHITHRVIALYACTCFAMIALALWFGRHGPAVVGGLAMGVFIGSYILSSLRNR